MKKTPLLLAAVAAFALLTPSSVSAAKGDPKATKATMMEKYDTNKNGRLDPDELEQIKSDFLANPKGELKRLDADHDGKLSDDELAVLSGKKGGGDTKKAGKKKKNGV